MAQRTTARSLTYGFAADADVRGAEVQSRGAEGMLFTLETPAGSVKLATPALGAHGVHNGLAAAAVGIAAGLDLASICEGLEGGWAAAHRDRLVRAGELTILDDCYNASPSSMIAALKLLATLPGRHVAVLGAMRELGDAHERGHREVGEAAGHIVDELIVVDEEARAIADAAVPALGSRVTLVADRDAAVEALRTRVRTGDSILVKASRGVELEKVVEALESWGRDEEAAR